MKIYGRYKYYVFIQIWDIYKTDDPFKKKKMLILLFKKSKFIVYKGINNIIFHIISNHKSFFFYKNKIKKSFSSNKTIILKTNEDFSIKINIYKKKKTKNIYNLFKADTSFYATNGMFYPLYTSSPPTTHYVSFYSKSMDIPL